MVFLRYVTYHLCEIYKELFHIYDTMIALKYRLELMHVWHFKQPNL